MEEPPLLTKLPVADPPALTCSIPPDCTVEPAVVPPEETISVTPSVIMLLARLVPVWSTVIPPG